MHFETLTNLQTVRLYHENTYTGTQAPGTMQAEKYDQYDIMW